MPTRYTLELEGLKGVVTNETFTEISQREEAKKTVKKALEERYVSGKNRWFFTPLRMSIAIGNCGDYAGQELTDENRILDANFTGSLEQGAHYAWALRRTAAKCGPGWSAREAA